MKTNLEHSKLINGWIVPPSTVKYSNTPLIKLSSVVSIVYYTNDNFIIKFYIGGESLEWNFEYKEDLLYTYKFICDNFLLKENLYGKFSNKDTLFIKD